jgi:hypothetical protein
VPKLIVEISSSENGKRLNLGAVAEAMTVVTPGLEDLIA